MKNAFTTSILLLVAAGAPAFSQAQTIIATDVRALAQDPSFQALPPGVTRLALAMDVSNGTVGPEYPSRVRVPPLERVYLSAPANWPASIQWTKNGRAIPGATASTLTLNLVQGSDSGTYSLVQNAPAPFIATQIRLDVMAESQLGNFSARIKLAPGNDVQIVGYVVNGRVPKRLLIRAVGPSLARFGVANPAQRPRFRIFNSDGSELIVVRPAVVLPPSYWSALFAQAGAFPLDGGELASASYDTFELSPGAYTLHASDDAQQGGVALVEVYEFETYPPIGG